MTGDPPPRPPGRPPALTARIAERARVARDRLEARFPRSVPFVRTLAHNWQDHRSSGLAAEVAFWGMLSIFPGLLALTAMLGFLDSVAGGDVADQAQTEVVELLREVLTDRADTTVDAVNALFEQSRPGVLTFAVAFALWTASRGFAAVVRALDVAYDVEERRSWLRQRAVAVGLALGSVVVAAALLAMLVVGPLLGTGRSVADDLGLGEGFATFWDWVRWPATALLAVAWATTVFHLAPGVWTPWRWDLPGAVVTATSWIAVSLGFRLYLDTIGAANQVFGILGGGIIALVWLYLLAVGLLLGGEVNALLANQRPGARTPSAAPPG